MVALAGRGQHPQRNSEERLRMRTDTTRRSIPAHVWIAAPDGAITFVNQQRLDYTGQTLEEALGWGYLQQSSDLRAATIILSVPANTKIPAHSHRDDRIATVVSGTS